VATAAYADIPRVIQSLWLQGLGQAPDLVRLNLARWSMLNPGHRLQVLELGDVEALFEGLDLPIGRIPAQALSDLVRTRLLLAHGGVWADATVFPVRPLDDWLPRVVTDAGFFAFERPGRDRIIASWFLAAAPGTLLMRELWAEAARYWSRPRRLAEGRPRDPVRAVSPEQASASDSFPYFWFHYLFQYVVETNGEARALWRRSKRLPAKPPHRLQSLFARNPRPKASAVLKAAHAAPVQKLDWRVPYPIDLLASIE
jgi:hypothetical protein